MPTIAELSAERNELTNDYTDRAEALTVESEDFDAETESLVELSEKIEKLDTAIKTRVRAEQMAGAVVPPTPPPPEERDTPSPESEAEITRFVDYVVEHGRGAAGQNFAVDVDRLANLRTPGGGQMPAQMRTLITDGGTLSTTLQLAGIVRDTYRFPRIRDLTGVQTIDDTSVEFVRVATEGHSQDYVAEGAVKPESSLTFEMKTENMAKIAHWVPVTDEALESRPEVERVVRDSLVEGVLGKEDTALLYDSGAGSPVQVQGIKTETGVLTRNWSAGSVGDYRFDALLRAMADVWVATKGEVLALDCLVSVLDWVSMSVEKDAEKRYILPDEFRAALGGDLTPRMLRFTATPKVTQGEAIVGAFGVGNSIYEKTGLRLKATDSHDTNFTKNIAVILAEERIAQTIPKPDAFCVVAFNSAPV